MPPSSIEVHPEALAEAKAAYDWYFERSPAAATAFIAELDAAVGAIGEAPQRCALYLARTRRYVMRRFPYAVVFRERSSDIQILAFAHTRRRPGYWRKRLR